MADLPAKYDSLRARLMASPATAIGDPITADEAQDFLQLAVAALKTTRGQTGTIKIARLLGLHKLPFVSATHKRAETLLAILELFGDRDWNDPAIRDQVFDGIRTLAADPLGMDSLVTQYRTNPAAPIPTISLPNGVNGTDALNIIPKLRQLGFHGVDDPMRIIHHLRTGKSVGVLQSLLRIRVSVSYLALPSPVIWQMLQDLSVDEIRQPTVKKAWLDKALAGQVSNINPAHYPAIQRLSDQLSPVQTVSTNLADGTAMPTTIPGAIAVQADELELATGKVQQMGFAASDAEDLTLYLIQPTAGVATPVQQFKIKLQLPNTQLDKIMREIIWRMLVQLDAAELQDPAARSDWLQQNVVEGGIQQISTGRHRSMATLMIKANAEAPAQPHSNPETAADSHATPPDGALAATKPQTDPAELAKILNTLQELGFKEKHAEKLANYLFTGSAALKGADYLAARLKGAFGIDGQMTRGCKDIVWKMLAQLSAADIQKNTPARAEWFMHAKAGDIPGLTQEHRAKLRLLENAPATTAGGTVPSTNIFPLTLGTNGPAAGSFVGITTADLNSQPTGSIDTKPQVIRLLGTDFRSPWQRELDKRQKLAETRKNPVREIEPLDDPLQKFIDAFSLGHMNLYAKQVLDCTTLLLQETSTSGDPPLLTCILAATVIMGRANEGILVEALPKIFKNIPPGRSWTSSWYKDIEIMIFEDVFGIHIRHANNWCASQNPPISPHDFMAGAIFEAHRYMAWSELNRDAASTRPGLHWPAKPHYERDIPNAFKTYIETQAAQNLMAAHGIAKKKDASVAVITQAITDAKAKTPTK